jgi:hypothetical protein
MAGRGAGYLAVQPGSEPALCPADVVASAFGQSMPQRAAVGGWPVWSAPAGHPPAAQRTVSLLDLEPTPAQAPSLLMDRAPSKRHDAAGKSSEWWPSRWRDEDSRRSLREQRRCPHRLSSLRRRTSGPGPGSGVHHPPGAEPGVAGPGQLGRASGVILPADRVRQTRDRNV